MQVVSLGEVLLIEVLPDIRWLAVLVALLRGLAGLSDIVYACSSPVSVKPLVAVPMARAAARAADPHQGEERVEDLVEDRFVPLVLDKRDPQRGT